VNPAGFGVRLCSAALDPKPFGLTGRFNNNHYAELGIMAIFCSAGFAEQPRRFFIFIEGSPFFDLVGLGMILRLIRQVYGTGLIKDFWMAVSAVFLQLWSADDCYALI
jgi:hypothetical protein